MSLETSDPDSNSKLQSAIKSLSLVLGPIDPTLSLLHDPQLTHTISAHLRRPSSGAGDNNLCRWFYDAFQSSDPDLQLAVLRHLPTIAGLYLPRAVRRMPLAGFEAILLALYAHETTARDGRPVTVSLPDLSCPSVYHEVKAATSMMKTEMSLAVVSPSLEPHGTVRSTKRARIVGVALELYYKKICEMPVSSKIEFCEFCVSWAGKDVDLVDEDDDEKKKGSILEEDTNGKATDDDHQQEGSSSSSSNDGKEVGNSGEEGVSAAEDENGGRIPLPWELLQPVLRILGHCLMGPNKTKELTEAALAATRRLYARALRDVDAQVILATGSLLRLGKMSRSDPEPDHTEIQDYMNPVITL